MVADEYGNVLHSPPPAEHLPERMQSMCDFANGVTPGYFLHPFVRAILLHFWLAFDHPFVDGNGRCARSLFYWSALSSGYSLCEFLSISRLIRNAPIKYGRAFLYSETDENDATYFVLYHLGLIDAAIEHLRVHLSQKQAALRETEAQLGYDIELNLRQIAVLSDALKKPQASFTIRSHQVKHNTVYETARKDLFDLERRGLLHAVKRGKTFYFYPASDLPDRIKSGPRTA